MEQFIYWIILVGCAMWLAVHWEWLREAGAWLRDWWQGKNPGDA